MPMPASQPATRPTTIQAMMPPGCNAILKTPPRMCSATLGRVLGAAGLLLDVARRLPRLAAGCFDLAPGRTALDFLGLAGGLVLHLEKHLLQVSLHITYQGS